jgi:hypothetical protein
MTAATTRAERIEQAFNCTLCGHDYEAHDWAKDVPMKYVPCPSCPDGLCYDPGEGPK